MTVSVRGYSSLSNCAEFKVESLLPVGSSADLDWSQPVAKQEEKLELNWDDDDDDNDGEEDGAKKEGTKDEIDDGQKNTTQIAIGCFCCPFTGGCN